MGEEIVPALILNQIITGRDLSIVKNFNLLPEFFTGYEDEFNFIVSETLKYGTVPDLPTILAKFPDYDFFKVQENPLSLVDKLMEEVGYERIILALNQVSKRAAGNVTLAAELMLDKANEILKLVKVPKGPVSYDVIGRAQDRYNDYLLRAKSKGLVGIPSGIPDLDQITKGWRDVDYVTIAARTQQGKSWILLYLLMVAWLSGLRVLLYDLENDPESVTGFRFDTLMAHFSNEGLMDGSKDLRGESFCDYGQYIDSLASYEVPFIIKDQKENVGKYTPSQIEADIEDNNPDIIGIDQLSLLAPDKRVSTIREGFVRVTRDLRQLTRRMKKPILQNAQIGREFAKVVPKDKEATPEIHQLSESGSIEQDSTRIITLRQLEDGILKLSVKKNTYGRSNLDALCTWDIDKGLIRPIITGRTLREKKSVF